MKSILSMVSDDETQSLEPNFFLVLFLCFLKLATVITLALCLSLAFLTLCRTFRPK